MSIEIKGGDKSARVIEVATSQLSVHSKQAELSPEMRDKDWAKFLAGIKKNGILQPLSVTQGNRVIDGKNRLKAAQLLGYENVRVVYEDIPEDEIATYITETKLSRDGLTKGQRGAIVINLHYDDERAKAEVRKQATQFGSDTDSPVLEGPEVSGEVAEILRLKASVSKTNIYYLLAVKRSRPDLYAKVFSGEYASIGRAHAEMKRDEAPEVEEVAQDQLPNELTERMAEIVRNSPEIDETDEPLSPKNILRHRIKTDNPVLSKNLAMDYFLLEEADEETVDSYVEQAKVIAQSALMLLERLEPNEDLRGLYATALHLFERAKEPQKVAEIYSRMEEK